MMPPGGEADVPDPAPILMRKARLLEAERARSGRQLRQRAGGGFLRCVPHGAQRLELLPRAHEIVYSSANHLERLVQAEQHSIDQHEIADGDPACIELRQQKAEGQRQLQRQGNRQRRAIGDLRPAEMQPVSKHLARIVLKAVDHPAFGTEMPQRFHGHQGIAHKTRILLTGLDGLPQGRAQAPVRMKRDGDDNDAISDDKPGEPAIHGKADGCGRQRRADQPWQKDHDHKLHDRVQRVDPAITGADEEIRGLGEQAVEEANTGNEGEILRCHDRQILLHRVQTARDADQHGIEQEARQNEMRRRERRKPLDQAGKEIGRGRYRQAGEDDAAGCQSKDAARCTTVLGQNAADKRAGCRCGRQEMRPRNIKSLSSKSL